MNKFGSKNKNNQFKLKFVTLTYFHMQNSMVIFTFFCFIPAITLDQVEYEEFNSGIHFFILDWKYPFLLNLAQKINFWFKLKLDN